MNLSKSLSKTSSELFSRLNENVDVIKRGGLCAGKKFEIIYVQEIVDLKQISQYALEPLFNVKKIKGPFIEYIRKNVVAIAGIEQLDTIEMCEKSILEGNAVLIFEGYKTALKLSVADVETRSISEPPTSAVIYGPREGFVESLRVNTILVRKRLPTSSLKIDKMQVGYYTKTKMSIMYLKDIADPKVVQRVKRKLSEIQIDGIVDSHYLVNYIEEEKNTIFKQVGKSEKPDVVVAKMLEGRVAIFVDGSPIVLTIPFMLIEDLQNSDDYYQGSFRITFIRTIRFFGVIVSVLLPGIYVAVQIYHYKIVPIKFLITLMNSIQGLPFPPFLEMLFVIILFEILYEASLRMPKYLGMALSIVGALILGDTAVKAGLISPPAVMIVAVSGIAFYTIPDESSQLSLLRLIFTMIGGTFGIYGLVIAVMLVVCNLNAKNSYGTPYLAPYAPRIKDDLGDALLKKDVMGRDTRPKSIPSQKKKRTGSEYLED